MLDVGCGAALAVTALLCGAEHVVAVDIDPNATKVALENAEKKSCKRAYGDVCGKFAGYNFTGVCGFKGAEV